MGDDGWINPRELLAKGSKHAGAHQKTGTSAAQAKAKPPAKLAGATGRSKLGGTTFAMVDPSNKGWTGTGGRGEPKRSANRRADEEDAAVEDEEATGAGHAADGSTKPLSASRRQQQRVAALAAGIVAYSRRARRTLELTLLTGRASLASGARAQVCLRRPPASLPGRLHPHQLAGLNWLLALWGCGTSGILADDMGLGKTIQVIAFLAQLREYALEDATAAAALGGGANGTAAPSTSASHAGAAAVSAPLRLADSRAALQAALAQQAREGSAAPDGSPLPAAPGGGAAGSATASKGEGARGGGGSLPVALPPHAHRLDDEAAFELLEAALGAQRDALAAASAASASVLGRLLLGAAAAAAAPAAAAATLLDAASDEDDEDEDEDDDDDEEEGGRGAARGPRAASSSSSAAPAAPAAASAPPVLCRAMARGSAGPHLIVVPTSTAENWCRELAKWAPALSLLPFTGSEAERRAARHRLGSTAVTVTTYSLLERPDVSRALSRVPWAMLVLDEAHSLKNSASKRYGVVADLRADMRLLLTGTPVQNNLRELVALLRVALPDLFWECVPGALRYEGGSGLFSGGGDEGGGGDDGLSPEERTQVLLVAALEAAYAREGKEAAKAAAAAARAAKPGAGSRVGGAAAAAAANCAAWPSTDASAAASLGGGSAGGRADALADPAAAAAAGGAEGTLASLFAAFVLRRTKDGVLSELPTKTRVLAWAAMTPAQQAVADTVHSLVLALDPARSSLLCQATAEAVAAPLTTYVGSAVTVSGGGGGGAGAGGGSQSHPGSAGGGADLAAGCSSSAGLVSAAAPPSPLSSPVAAASASEGAAAMPAAASRCVGPVFVGQLAHAAVGERPEAFFARQLQALAAAPAHPAGDAGDSVSVADCSAPNALGASGSHSPLATSGAGGPTAPCNSMAMAVDVEAEGSGPGGDADTTLLLPHPSGAAKGAPPPAAVARPRGKSSALERELALLRDGHNGSRGAGAGAKAKGGSAAAAAGSDGSGGGGLNRMAMLLRKVANHPLLLRCRYSDAAVLHVARLIWGADEAAAAAAPGDAGLAGAGGARAKAAGKLHTAPAGAGGGSKRQRIVDAEGGGGAIGLSALDALEPLHLLPLAKLLPGGASTFSGEASSDGLGESFLPLQSLPVDALKPSALPSGSAASASHHAAAAPAADTAALAAADAAFGGPCASAEATPAGYAAFYNAVARSHARMGAGELLAWAGGDAGLADFAQSLLDSSDFDVHRAVADYVAGEGRTPTSAALSRMLLPPAAFLDCGKARALAALLARLAAAGSRALIFSQFTQVLDILQVVLRQLGHRFLRIDGSVPSGARQGLVDAFAADEGILAFLLSTRAGGVGLNLTAADTVIIYDCDFNPLNDAQAEDRAYRIGQARPVTVHRLLTAGSIEVHMADVAGGKWSMAERVMSMSER